MKKVATLFVLALVSAALVACGGDDDDDGTTTTDTGGQATNGAATDGGGAAGGGGGEGGASTLAFEADPGGNIAYATDSATSKAGEVTVSFENPQPVAHDVVIEDDGGKEVGATDVITESSDSTTIKDLKPGKYTFFCSVPGHREAGMEGPLTVK